MTKFSELPGDLQDRVKNLMSALRKAVDNQIMLPTQGKLFGWDFSQVVSDCGTAGCMLGLDRVLRGYDLEQRYGFRNLDYELEMIGVPLQVTSQLFYVESDNETNPVTPDEAADRLEDWMADRPIRVRTVDGRPVFE